jgi:hypothetical protein
MRVSDAPFSLKVPLSQPFIREREALTAVVVLGVINPDGLTVLEDCAVLRHPIGHLCENFGDMDGCIRVMPNAKKQDLSIQLVYAASRALETVRRQRQRIGGDGRRLRAERSKGEGMGTSAYLG